MEKINKRQKAIFDFIKERINEKGIAPSVREIGEAVGLRGLVLHRLRAGTQ